MDLELSDDQELFRETTARFIDARCPIPRVRRARRRAGRARPRASLGDAGELGWFALFVPEEHGGGTRVRLAAARRGDRRRGARSLRAAGARSSPPTWSRSRWPRDGSAEQQSSVPPRARLRRAHRVVGDQRPRRRPGGRRGACAPRTGDGYTLDGTAGLVPEGAERRRVPRERGRRAGAASRSSWSPPTRRGRRSSRSTGSTSPAGSSTCASTVSGRRRRGARRRRRRAGERRRVSSTSPSRSTLAESVGAMRRLAEITVDYAKARIAFGRPDRVVPGAQAHPRRRQLLDRAEHRGARRRRRGGGRRAGPPRRRSSASPRPTPATPARNVAQSASRPTAASASRGSTTCTSTCGASPPTACSTATRTWHRERICRIHGLCEERR